MDCEELLLSGRCLEGSDMAKAVCMFSAGERNCVSAVVEAICIVKICRVNMGFKVLLTWLN